ncbi:hypothetical protein GZ77_10245 [Endozoicomonas montiporae]|uniref:Uncharacterized protein n=2 Tax=Endozoicomonas montiporae TaxID=1027273 RepID=A0A081N8B1_9GAMM|nr:hypothetical protein [Endozoicomonas montiporae]AMO55427.1 hypothetical protein EZMO1_1234 [Endozoicomonas montiporae CL-33]KEQ14684.1 hypothetical protein GZ77_10245 [Endozoicomonas montiporae]
MKLSLSLSLCLIASTTILLAENALATPLPGSTPAYNATTSPLPSATAEPKLYRLCSGIVENLELLTTDVMKQAAVDKLERVFDSAPQAIDRCVIKTPVNGSYLDESINGFNTGKPWEETANTAFLLVGVGMKSTPVTADEDCASKTPVPVIAGKQKGHVSTLPDEWLEQFQIKGTINLESGQKLIGIPLDRSNGSLANDYFVGLKKKIVVTHYCRRSGHYSYHIQPKAELIHFHGAGILVTGITTLPTLTTDHYSSSKHRDYCRFDYGHTNINIQSHDIHEEMLKGELDFKSLEVPVNGYMVNISGNEFFQIRHPAIDISLADQSKDVDSRLFNSRNLIGFSDNQVYTCYRGEAGPAMSIDIAYQDASPQPVLIRALDFKNNQLLGKTPQAISLVLPEHVKVDITNNQFVTTKEGNSPAKGISIAGPSQSSENWQVPATINLTGNTIKGYQAALSLTGYLKLVLKSNQLLGERVAIERRRDLTLPVTLTGDGTNQFKAGDYHPCFQLEDTNIIGEFVFSDGKTICPKKMVAPGIQPAQLIKPSFTPPVSQQLYQGQSTSTKALGYRPSMTSGTFERLPETTTTIPSDSLTNRDRSKTSPSQEKQIFSTPAQPAKSSDSAKASVIGSQPEKNRGSRSLTLSGSVTPPPVAKSVSVNSQKNLQGTPTITHSPTVERRVKSTRLHPDPSPARKQPSGSQSPVTEMQQAFNNTTLAGYGQHLGDKKSDHSPTLNNWQIALTTVGSVLALGVGICYVKYRHKHSVQSKNLEMQPLKKDFDI